MNAVYASLICIAGALVCVVLRQMRPEMAVAAALAAGAAVILICMDDIRQTAAAGSHFSKRLTPEEEEIMREIIREFMA